MTQVESLTELMRSRNKLENEFREAQLEVDARFVALSILMADSVPINIPPRVQKHLDHLSGQRNKEVSFRAP